jgi:hypothetical protein
MAEIVPETDSQALHFDSGNQTGRRSAGDIKVLLAKRFCSWSTL